MDNKKSNKEPEFFDDEFGLYYDGEFYEEVDETPIDEPQSINEDLIKEIERLRFEIKNIGRQEAAAVPPAAPVQNTAASFGAAQNAGQGINAVQDGYQLRQGFDALRAYIRRSDVPLPLKLRKMLEFNRTVSSIPYGEYDDIASAFSLLKSGFLKTEITGGQAEEIISFNDYGYDIVTEDDENNTRSFLLYKELYNPDDEPNYHETAARLLEAKNKLQENKNTAANEQLYTGILNCSAELILGGSRSRAEIKANIAALFKELLTLVIDDIVNFPEVIRPGTKSAPVAYAPVAYAPAPTPVPAAPAPVPAAQEEQKPQFPFMKRPAGDGQPRPPKPANPPKAHYLARVIANRMILDNLLSELDEKDLTRAQRDKIIKKLVPGASRLDDQPKDIVKIANTLVADKLNAVNRQYEKALKARDKEIRKAAREQAAKERAEKAAARAAAAQTKAVEKARSEAAAADPFPKSR